MKILHITLLIVSLSFVNAQHTLASLYSANSANCLKPDGYEDGSHIRLLVY